jgi:polysaccharide pyruvyl transferase CsaB
MSGLRYRVALAGYYGFGNFGDELLAEASIEALLRCGLKHDQIVLLSNTPKESTRKFGIDAVDRWSPARIRKTLRLSETLLLGGGGLFQDATSLRSCLYYWGLVRMARFMDAVPWALGQSVGPLSTRAGRWLTRDALRLCRVVQVRDSASRLICDSLGVFVEQGHDLVFSLSGLFGKSIFRQASPDAFAPSGKFLINLRPCAGGLPERFARAIAKRLSASENEPQGIALSDEDEHLMERLIERKFLPSMPVFRIMNASDAACAWNGAAGSAGMRLHFAILSVLAEIPLVVAPYDPKVRAFADSHGIPMWLKGTLPKPRSVIKEYATETVQEEIDVLCRKILHSEP